MKQLMRIFLAVFALSFPSAANGTPGDILIAREYGVAVYDAPSSAAQVLITLDEGRKLKELKREGPAGIEKTAAEPVRITIDPRITYQVMQGFGHTNRVWDDPHVSSPHISGQTRTFIPQQVQDEILTQLYRTWA